MYFILLLINRTNPRGILLCNYWWKNRKCWLLASALHIMSDFKRGNQILCCLQDWWKYKVECCSFWFRFHMWVSARIQSLRPQHGSTTEILLGSWLADKCTTQQSLTVQNQDIWLWLDHFNTAAPQRVRPLNSKEAVWKYKPRSSFMAFLGWKGTNLLSKISISAFYVRSASVIKINQLLWWSV